MTCYEYTDRSISKLNIALENAKKKPNVTEEEIKNIEEKIRIYSTLQQLVVMTRVTS